MTGIARDVLIAALAYVTGCCTTGYYLTRWRSGTDIRTLGSGSTGARNVGRTLGRGGFVITLLADCTRGAFAVWLAQRLGASPWAAALVLPIVVAGHCWPVQLRFIGGRGVAVALGALLLLDARLLLALAGLVLAGYALHRSFTLAGVIAFVALPIAAWLLAAPLPLIVATLLLAVIIVFTHRTHLLNRLRDGRPRISSPAGRESP